jgi:hypothetical protein
MTTARDVSQGNAADWVKVTDQAGWQPRDSQGEVAYGDRLWILGGWFNSYQPCPRDVWSSADGVSWTRVREVAPWKHGDLPMSLVFDDKMWFMGGWYNGRLPGHSAGNEVWWSTDGAEWHQATASAGWTPRLAAGAVVFDDRMWILGGTENYFFGDRDSLRNDVWYSSDGTNWTLATADAGWAPRAYHQAVAHNGRIWVLGGGNYLPENEFRNDVWCSEDGVNWEQVTEAASWGARLWFSSVIYRDRMWVLGGWAEETDNFGDVWYSEDGEGWKQLRSDVIWKARHEHSAFVFQDRIWVAGGHARPLNSEVWSLYLPEDWSEAERASSAKPRQ